ncbi:hypothetical protein [Virgibacillus salexigens]|uniref:Cation-transporting P-type ATPase N-terminal domain-containing protein n=1 Tax=Virgibacillus kapii TaxID=1638645 RepID=A0ABQ2DA07_9BACI|nr:hypothetical protein [Virgibacillus kapii]GGJ48785.1 hypothetical protein GCM10007111_08490 [Virgibacillus kapii]
MKIADFEKERIAGHTIEQLRQLGCETEGLTHREATKRLQAERAKNVIVKSPHASWF